METLAEIYKRHSGTGKFNDKGSTHDYIGVYETLLAPYRSTAKRVMELGLFDGHSYLMWREYFSEETEVHGIDCDLRPHGGMADLGPLLDDSVNLIWIGDASDKVWVGCEFKDWLFDVIIEDCSHDIDQQLRLWEVWEPRLAAGGCYVIEDLQTEAAIVKFRKLGFEIMDRRGNGRYDNILAVMRK